MIWRFYWQQEEVLVMLLNINYVLPFVVFRSKGIIERESEPLLEVWDRETNLKIVFGDNSL